MSVTIPTKDLGDVQNVYRKEIDYRKTEQDKIGNYIKKEMKING